MRIAVSGTACQGKTTFINDFKKEWPMYTVVDSSYRKLVKDGNHSKKATKDNQWKILNCLIDDLQKHGQKGNKVIFDRCPLDNIVYTIWGNEKNKEEFDDAFVEKCIPLVRESMRLLDMVFFIPITKAAPVEIADKETRETDEIFIKEIDLIFKGIVHQVVRTGVSAFFTKDDSPGIIEIFGKPEERVQLARYYLNADGDLIGEESSIINSLDEDTISKLLAEQQEALVEEKKQKNLYNRLIIGDK